MSRALSSMARQTSTGISIPCRARTSRSKNLRGRQSGTSSSSSRFVKRTTGKWWCRGILGAMSSTSRRGTLHDGDRGGFIFAPEVGLHEDVHELDFSSLYPNIICTRNVSPDVIRYGCHRDRDNVPGLGYSICDDRGYLVEADHRYSRRDQSRNLSQTMAR